MSDTSGSGAATAASSYDGGGVPAPSPQAQTLSLLNQGDQQGQPQGQQPQGLADGFLSRVDPAHRTIVEPYVKQWDAGVTRRFQELHGQLQPYQEIGADPESLRTAWQIYQAIDEDPQAVMALLQEAIGQQGQPPQLGAPAAPQGQPQPSTQPLGQPGTPPGLPPEVQAQIDEWGQKFPMFEQVLEALASQHLQSQQQQQEAQEDAQLDQYFQLLKQEYGDFDENYVIAQMMAGRDGEEAVQAYHQLIQGQVNDRARRPNVPPVLGGGGSVPQEGQTIAKASRGDVKNLVANILAAANQQ